MISQHQHQAVCDENQELTEHVETMKEEIEFLLKQTMLMEHYQNSERIRILRNKYNIDW